MRESLFSLPLPLHVIRIKIKWEVMRPFQRRQWLWRRKTKSLRHTKVKYYYVGPSLHLFLHFRVKIHDRRQGTCTSKEVEKVAVKIKTADLIDCIVVRCGAYFPYIVVLNINKLARLPRTKYNAVENLSNESSDHNSTLKFNIVLSTRINRRRLSNERGKNLSNKIFL